MMFRFEKEKIRKRIWFFPFVFRSSIFGSVVVAEAFSMADALSVIPAAVLRNLADKLYEKRKNAALEVSLLNRSMNFIFNF